MTYDCRLEVPTPGEPARILGFGHRADLDALDGREVGGETETTEPDGTVLLWRASDLEEQ